MHSAKIYTFTAYNPILKHFNAPSGMRSFPLGRNLECHLNHLNSHITKCEMGVGYYYLVAQVVHGCLNTNEGRN